METTDNVFSNRDITVTYEPRVCINAERCAKELSNVFRHSVIPWIDLDGDTTERIIRQVRKCPSGALKFSYNNSNDEVA
ncbi:MAG TPA: (4Fe-4S)-binding protein [Aquaticitalea sp.]|nr:(4Fe-4S)-binding protein [Aquaticitalea sp.]HNU59023.1 (4Fe-4S)-binding protein [Aquaticitalea sp.]